MGRPPFLTSQSEFNKGETGSVSKPGSKIGTPVFKPSWLSTKPRFHPTIIIVHTYPVPCRW